MNDQNELSGGPDGRRASALLHGATTDFAPDVDRLVQGGVARGRTLRRRRRVGSSLAAVAVVGILGVAAGAGTGLLGSSATPAPSRYADSPSASPSASTSPNAPQADPAKRQPIDATLVVTADDAPEVIGDLVGDGAVEEILRDAPYGVIDEPQRKLVHFRYSGTLATFSIEPAESLATCAELVDPADQPDGEPGGVCTVQDGVVLLRSEPTTADGVTGQGVMAFVHGYVVSALSYNAPDGKDVATTAPSPPLTMDDLTTIVTSEVWFES